MDKVAPSVSSSGGGVECKIVLVGDSRSGKTALVHQFLNDKFLDIYTPTGFERYTDNIYIADKHISFTIWDTSGSTAYDSVRPLAYQDAKVFLLCFHIGQPETLDNAINKWYPEIRKHSPNVPVILCGCQCDTRNDIDTIASLAKMRRIPVTSEQALNSSRQISATTYVETSAKTSSKNTREAFEVAVLAALGRLNKNHVAMQRQRSYVKSKNKRDLTRELRNKAKTTCIVM
uniref:Uncharacterized protein n=1 Tax=Strigamia maritima TaxID=126957 RepID=T1JA45_STRMM